VFFFLSKLFINLIFCNGIGGCGFGFFFCQMIHVAVAFALKIVFSLW